MRRKQTPWRGVWASALDPEPSFEAQRINLRACVGLAGWDTNATPLVVSKLER
jgi:hypothetical protein